MSRSAECQDPFEIVLARDGVERTVTLIDHEGLAADGSDRRIERPLDAKQKAIDHHVRAGKAELFEQALHTLPRMPDERELREQFVRRRVLTHDQHARRRIEPAPVVHGPELDTEAPARMASISIEIGLREMLDPIQRGAGVVAEHTGGIEERLRLAQRGSSRQS